MTFAASGINSQRKMDKINITANSRPVQTARGATLESLARELGLNPARCVAEVNQRAVRAADFANTKLSDGDKIEIMQIVAGG